jgi:hypothetical protein
VCLKEKGGTGVVGGLGLWIDDVPGLNSFFWGQHSYGLFGCICMLESVDGLLWCCLDSVTGSVMLGLQDGCDI